MSIKGEKRNDCRGMTYISPKETQHVQKRIMWKNQIFQDKIKIMMGMWDQRSIMTIALKELIPFQMLKNSIGRSSDTQPGIKTDYFLE